MDPISEGLIRQIRNGEILTASGEPFMCVGEGRTTRENKMSNNNKAEISRQAAPLGTVTAEVYKCLFCGKDNHDWRFDYHKECFECPKCGEDDFIAWKPQKPYVARCLNCLHRWELLKTDELT